MDEQIVRRRETALDTIEHALHPPRIDLRHHQDLLEALERHATERGMKGAQEYGIALLWAALRAGADARAELERFVDHLEQLNALGRSGALTHEEVNAARQRLLGLNP